MANPDRDIYGNEGTTNRTVYSRESNATGWFVGIIVALALLAIGYLVFSANSGPSTTSTTVNNTPAIESPADNSTAPMTAAPPADNSTAPMTEAPPAEETPPASETAPAAEAPATEPPPATEAPATQEPAPGA